MKHMTRNKSLWAYAAALMAIIAIGGCAEETTSNHFGATVNGKSVEFETPKISIKSSNEHMELTFQATENGTRSMSVFVELATVPANTLDLEIDGTVSIENGIVKYLPGFQNSPQVQRVYLGHACESCDDVKQSIFGTLVLDKDGETYTGELMLEVDGSIHEWGTVSAEVDSNFEVAAQRVEPLSCTDCNKSRTITLSADDGADFANEAVLSQAMFSADLYATKGPTKGATLKLTPGGSNATKNNPVNWFQTGQAKFRKFSSLAKIPNEYPEDTKGLSLVLPKAGMGFVLKNNRSDGYTKGWITKTSSTKITIEYVIID